MADIGTIVDNSRAHGYQDVYDTLIQQAVKDMATIAVDKVGTEIDAVINKWVRMGIPINI